MVTSIRFVTVSPEPLTAMADTLVPLNTCGASVPLTQPICPSKVAVCHSSTEKPEASTTGEPLVLVTFWILPSAPARKMAVVPTLYCSRVFLRAAMLRNSLS